MDAVNVDDLGRPTSRREEVADLETEAGGKVGEASESTGRVRVDSVCTTRCTVGVFGAEAGVV